MGLLGPNIKKMQAKGNVDGIINALDSSNSKVYKEACIALTSFPQQKVIDALIFKVLEHAKREGTLVQKSLNEALDNSFRRYCAQEALEGIGTPAYDSIMSEINRNDISAGVRNYFYWSLGGTGDSRAFDVLKEIINEQDYELKVAAAIGLSNLSSRPAIDCLIAQLTDEPVACTRRSKAEDFICIILDTIGARGDFSCIRNLEPYLSIENELVQKMASEAIETIKARQSENH